MKYLSIFMILVSFAANAQTQADPKEVVLYDPLFWKSELSLRNDQSKKIQQINSEFYQTLRSIKDETSSREAKTDRLEQGLQERSQKIFQTLMPKQRRRLEKIIDKNAPITAP